MDAGFQITAASLGESSQMARLPLNPTMMKSRQEWQIIRLVQSVELLCLTFHR